MNAIEIFETKVVDRFMVDDEMIKYLKRHKTICEIQKFRNEKKRKQTNKSINIKIENSLLRKDCLD